MRLIDADALCDGRVENDPVVIAAKCAETIIVEETKEYKALCTQSAASLVEHTKEIVKLLEQLKESEQLTNRLLQSGFSYRS